MPAFEESASTQSAAAPEFYTWTFPGAPVRIHLHLNVVERVGREVRRAFESIPSHSVEIGGILLGKTDFHAGRVVEIRDFEPFLCEYRPDHKFILSDADGRKLEKLLATRRSMGADGLTVVGFYRSHIGEGLSLSEHDVSTAQTYFCAPANVFLLVKPAPDGSSTGGFFFGDDDRIDAEFTFLEFPFEVRQLAVARTKPLRMGFAAPPRADEEAPEETPAFPVFDVTVTPELPSPEPRTPRGLHAAPGIGRLWYLLLAVLLMALGAVSYSAYMKWISPPPAAPVLSNASELALVVERQGADLRVSWNRHSFAVARATNAVLAILDGDLQEQVLRLEIEQLRHGSVLYSPANTTVQFRLEVTDPENVKTSETVLALTAARPDLTGRPPLAPPPAIAPPSPAAERHPAARDFGQPVRVMLVDPPSRTPGVPPHQAAAESPPVPTPQYIRPLPIHEVQPSLPPDSRKRVTSLTEVEIRVQIDDAGRVVKAEPLPSKGVVSGFLVGAARNAAMLFRFAPARRDDQPVPSELILKFQFLPAERR